MSDDAVRKYFEDIANNAHFKEKIETQGGKIMGFNNLNVTPGNENDLKAAFVDAGVKAVTNDAKNGRNFSDRTPEEQSKIIMEEMGNDPKAKDALKAIAGSTSAARYENSRRHDGTSKDAQGRPKPPIEQEIQEKSAPKITAALQETKPTLQAAIQKDKPSVQVVQSEPAQPAPTALQNTQKLEPDVNKAVADEDKTLPRYASEMLDSTDLAASMSTRIGKPITMTDQLTDVHTGEVENRHSKHYEYLSEDGKEVIGTVNTSQKLMSSPPKYELQNKEGTVIAYIDADSFDKAVKNKEGSISKNSLSPSEKPDQEITDSDKIKMVERALNNKKSELDYNLPHIQKFDFSDLKDSPSNTNKLPPEDDLARPTDKHGALKDDFARPTDKHGPIKDELLASFTDKYEMISGKPPIVENLSINGQEIDISRGSTVENLTINGQQINLMELLSALIKLLPAIPQQEQAHGQVNEQVQTASVSAAPASERVTDTSQPRQETHGHVNHIAEAAKFKGDKAIDAKGLNEYAASIGGGNSQKGMDTIIKDIAGPDGKLTDAKIEQYLKDSQGKKGEEIGTGTDLDDSRITRKEHVEEGKTIETKGMIAARENLKDALRKNASPEMAQMIPHKNSHKAAPDQYAHQDAPKPEQQKQAGLVEVDEKPANSKDEVANNPTIPTGAAQAMAGLAGMASGMVITGSPAIASALSGLAAAATNMVQERSAQPKVLEYAGSDYSNKSAQAIGNAQSNGKDVGGIG